MWPKSLGGEAGSAESQLGPGSPPGFVAPVGHTGATRQCFQLELDLRPAQQVKFRTVTWSVAVGTSRVVNSFEHFRGP